MTAQLPAWPTVPPTYGSVVLRAFRDEDAHLAVEAERERFSFAIADAESYTAVGAIGLSLQDLSAGRATAGYAVSPLHRGRGIATSALKALTSFAWTIAALHRVELYIEPLNTSSIHVAEAAGYQREGLLRSHQEIGGTRRDMLLYARTRP